MKNITLSNTLGAKFSGQIPEGWQELTLSDWLAFEKAKEGRPEGMYPALLAATLTKLPDKALAEDVSLVPLILDQMPWLGVMPEPVPLLTFTHAGTTYEHVGNLEKVNMAQFEALLSCLEQAEGNHMQAVPELLAVLYKPKGLAQDLATVRATTVAFQSLPMDHVWGALAFFLTNSEPLATRILTYFQGRGKVQEILTLAEQVLTVPASRKRSSRIAAWLGLTYIRSVKKLL